MRRVFSYTIILLFAAVSVGVHAQNKITTPLPGKCTAFKPESLYSSILFTDVADKLAASNDYGQSTTKKSKEYWIVYSDRADNPTYTAPGSGSVFGPGLYPPRFAQP